MDGVVQNRATSDFMPMSENTSQATAGGLAGSGAMSQGLDIPPVRSTDEEMIDDALLAVSMMSDSYRRAVKETSDERVAAALIGMRRDEDNQKAMLARYVSQRL